MQLKWDATLDETNFVNGLKGIRDGVRQTADYVEQSGSSMEQTFANVGSKISQIAGIGFGLSQVKDFIGKVAEVRASFQDIESSMEVFLGSQEKAAEFTQELKDYAYYNMFEFKDLAEASKQMIAYGVETENIISTLDKLSNVATGTQASLSDLVAMYNKAKSVGKIDSHGLDSWASKGVVIKDELKEMGVAIDGTSVSFEQLNMVLDKVTGEGGRFHDLMGNMMENISAEVGQLEDNLALMFDEIGRNWQDEIKGSIKIAGELVDHYKEIGTAIMALISTYGLYKAALIGVSAYEKASTNIAYDAEINALQSLIPQKKEEAATSLEQSVANGTLTKEKAAYIQQLREEALLQAQALNLKAAEAAQNYISATNEAAALSEKLDKAKENVQAAQDAYDYAMRFGDAEKLEATAIQLSTAETERNAIAKELEAARTNVAIAASERDAAAKSAEAAATGLDTAATIGDTTATGLLTQAKVALNKAVLALNKTFLASPWFWIAAAVTGVVYSIYKLVTAENAYQKSERETNDEIARRKKLLDEQQNSAESYLRTIQDENASGMQRVEAYRKLLEIFPEFNKDLTLQELASMDAAKAQKMLNESMDEKRIQDAKDAIAEAEETVEGLKKQLDRAGGSQWASVLSGQLQVAQLNVQKLKKELQELLGLQKDADVIKPPTVTYAEAFSKAADKYVAAVNEVNKIKANPTKYTQEQFEKATADLDTAKKDYQALGGDVSSNKNSAKDRATREREQRDYLQLIETQGKERQRAIEDMALSTRQAELDAEEKSTANTIAQIRLDFDKRRTEIQRGYEDLKEQKIASAKQLFEANPANENKVFDPSSVDTSYTEEEIANYNALIKAAEKERDDAIKEAYDSEIQAMNQYLSEYGDYWEKRKAITALYQKQIDDATTEGEKKSLQKKMSGAIADLEIEYKTAGSAITNLFDDMKDKGVADLRKIADAGEKAFQFLKSKQWDENKGLDLGITQEQFEKWTATPEQLEKIRKAIEEINEEADNSETALNKMSKGLEALFNAKDTNSTKKALDKITSGANEVFQAVNFVSDSLKSLGDSLGSGALSGIGEGISALTDAGSAAMSGAAAGATLGPWGAAAGAALGAVTSLVGSLSKLHDAKYERKIQQIQQQIDTLQKNYAVLGDKIEQAFSKDASNLIEQQNKMLQQQKVLIQNQIKEEEKKKKTDNDRINEWKQQIEEINKTLDDNKKKAIDVIFGEDVKSAIEDFASAYADAWANGEDKAKSAKDVVKNMMKQMVTESIKAAIQSSGAMDRIRQTLQSFYADNVLTGWEQDYIYNMAEDLQKQLDSRFGWADSLLGGSDSYSQEASANAWGSMSQDQAEELNGRFTAFQISNQEISDKMSLVVTNITAMMALSTSFNSTLVEIRNLHIIGNSHLEDIAKYTKPLQDLEKKLDKIIENTQ